MYNDIFPEYYKMPPPKIDTGMILGISNADSLCQFMFDDFETLETYTEGAQGHTVLSKYIGKKTINGLHPDESCILKCYDRYRFLETERHIYGKLDTNSVKVNVPKLYGCAKTDPPGPLNCLVLEYIKGVPLSAYLDESADPHKLGKYNLSRKDKILITNGLIDTCRQIHKNHIVHRDIKPSNIVVTTDFDIFLIDFGVSCDVDEGIGLCNGPIGSPRYRAPEVYEIIDYIANVSSDMWSLGKVILELFHDDEKAMKQLGTIINSLMSSNPDDRIL